MYKMYTVQNDRELGIVLYIKLLLLAMLSYHQHLSIRSLNSMLMLLVITVCIDQLKTNLIISIAFNITYFETHNSMYVSLLSMSLCLNRSLKSELHVHQRLAQTCVMLRYDTHFWSSLSLYKKKIVVLFVWDVQLHDTKVLEDNFLKSV